MDTRTINGKKYSTSELVDNAIAIVDSKPLDIESAKRSLARIGNANPSDELIKKYAREDAILDILGRETGANFNSQIGKINFDNRETAIAGVESYLNRRNAGRKANWGRK